jgi:hypothetical protein
MTLTIHRWDAIPDRGDKRLKLFPIAGTDRKLILRKDIGPYLVAFTAEYHKRIAPIDVGTFDDWSWCPPRTGNASSQVSDHCAGVAIDLNATREGSEGAGSLKFWANPVKRARLNALRKEFSLLEWGGDYSAKNRDPMHWTFSYGVKAPEVLAAMKRLRIGSDGKRIPVVLAA